MIYNNSVSYNNTSNNSNNNNNDANNDSNTDNDDTSNHDDDRDDDNGDGHDDYDSGDYKARKSKYYDYTYHKTGNIVLPFFILLFIYF